MSRRNVCVHWTDSELKRNEIRDMRDEADELIWIDKPVAAWLHSMSGYSWSFERVWAAYEGDQKECTCGTPCMRRSQLRQIYQWH